MSANSIHLINSRSCVYLDVIKEVLNADADQMFQMIRNETSQLKAALEKKGVKYESLRAVLSPSKVRKHKEIVLCFEAEVFGDCYGIAIHELVFPLINKKRSHVIQIGDLLYDKNYAIKLMIMENQICYFNDAKINSNCNYYLIYINNITDDELGIFNDYLKDVKGYIGYCDVSNTCLFKEIIANELVQICIQSEKIMILPHMDGECADDENVNMYGIDFEKYGFKFISISETWYRTYLNYKVTSKVVDSDDIKMSLNSITKTPEDISNYSIYISPDKYKYICDNKGLISESGLADLSYEEFLCFLNNNIEITTLCDLEFKDDVDAVLFATIFEYKRPDTERTYSFLISFQYKYYEKRLVVTSMY